MESPAARSLALHAVKCFRRQWNPVLNSGMLLDQQRFGAFAGCAPGVEAGMVDSTPTGILTTKRSELANDEVSSKDWAISLLDSLIAPIRNAEVGHTSGGWNRLHMMNSFSLNETHARWPEFDALSLNSAQREQIEHLALHERRTRDRDISRFLSDLLGSGREIRSVVTGFMDGPVEACTNSCSEQKPRNEVSRSASLIGRVEGDLWLFMDSIPFQCSSVKRKRKKKMNKHKQRKLRRRDRHRNS